jgi:hypothetical protein
VQPDDCTDGARDRGGTRAIDPAGIRRHALRSGGSAAFEALLQAFNDTPHDITLHVRDIKGGGSPCSDEVFTQKRDYLNPVAGPLVYVPGDNEWTDCHRKSAGQYDPLERLAFLRQTFFVPGRSLGQTPLTIEQQAQAGPPFEMMIENARW